MSKKLTIQNVVADWVEVGQTYNEDYGVDDVRGKLINGEWAYVQVEWYYRVPSQGFIIYDGKILENLDELPQPKPINTKGKS